MILPSLAIYQKSKLIPLGGECKLIRIVRAWRRKWITKVNRKINFLKENHVTGTNGRNF